jgi:ribonuclease HI
MSKQARKKYYAYFLPGAVSNRGIVESWSECEKLVKGVSGARYRAFSSRALAEEWLNRGAPYNTYSLNRGPVKKHLPRGIYFDAGTGRGHGVEISVTDEKGTDLLYKVLSKNLINKFGKYRIKSGATNNYGELLAMKYALELALRHKIKRVYGDSKLVINWWSKGLIRKERVSSETVKLAEEVKKLREKFISRGGKVSYIEGSHNPADLGFHK